MFQCNCIIFRESEITKLLKLQLNKSSRLKCARDRCCMIKYKICNVDDITYFMCLYFIFSLLYNGYLVFPGGKVRPGRAADHSPPSSAAVMEE